MKIISISIEEDLLMRLKKMVPTRQLSRFVTEAIQRELDNHQQSIQQAYLQASQDLDRTTELKEWKKVNDVEWS